MEMTKCVVDKMYITWGKTSTDNTIDDFVYTMVSYINNISPSWHSFRMTVTQSFVYAQ